MPSDSVHTIFNFIVYAIISILHVTHPVFSVAQYAIFTLFFIIGTLILNPDLDTNSKSSRRCGIACKPYKWAFHHRGLSHNWLWGTTARILYVALIALIILWLVWVFVWQFKIDGSAMLAFVRLHVKEIGIAGTGLFLSNIMHIILDWIA